MIFSPCVFTFINISTESCSQNSTLIIIKTVSFVSEIYKRTSRDHYQNSPVSDKKIQSSYKSINIHPKCMQLWKENGGQTGYIYIKPPQGSNGLSSRDLHLIIKISTFSRRSA
jgi:hypothetical protein